MGILTRLLTVVASIASSVGTPVGIQVSPKLKQGTCNVLALSGGGAFGAVQMGVLDGLTATGQAPVSYDIITGISAGGLNAGFLSYYTNVSQALPDIYGILSGLKSADVYESALLNILSEWSYYSTAPLSATLTNVLSGKQPLPSGVGPITLIGASNVLTHQLDIWHFERLSVTDQVAALMATSAIPLVFPPQQINGSLYVDGGVISNELIHQAMGQVVCDSYNVVFVSASAASASSVLRPMPKGLFSYVGAVVNLLVDTFDYQLAQVTNCSYPRGTIQACFPTSPTLGNYSILNFDYGAELYALGRESYACEKLALC